MPRPRPLGDLGKAPGANIGENAAIFEATAPPRNPLASIGSKLILSGVMMLEFLGWQEAADLITKGLSAAIADQQVTYDLARLMEPQVDPVSCSGFAKAIIERFWCRTTTRHSTDRRVDNTTRVSSNFNRMTSKTISFCASRTLLNTLLSK